MSAAEQGDPDWMHETSWERQNSADVQTLSRAGLVRSQHGLPQPPDRPSLHCAKQQSPTLQ